MLHENEYLLITHINVMYARPKYPLLTGVSIVDYSIACRPITRA